MTYVGTPRSQQSAAVLALPASGEVLRDQRGDGRWMRVTWHEDVDVVVLSLWKHTSCVGTLRLDRSQVPELVDSLVRGLAGTSDGGARGGS